MHLCPTKIIKVGVFPNMGKITEIKFVGQLIFKQIRYLINNVDIQVVIRKHESDYYCKSFKTRTHLFAMSLEILGQYDSI